MLNKYPKNILSILLFLVSTLGSIYFCEILIENFKSYKNIYLWEHRYMLFQGDPNRKVFENYNDSYKYSSNNEVHAKTFYFSNNDWILEYEYKFRTNNLGLIQNSYVKKNEPSIVLLGNSFTEGQGFEPWFNLLPSKFRGYQLINGGLMGTGPGQWLALLDEIKSNDIMINKVLVIAISQDYTREFWNFSDQTLRCIENYERCVGNENFYGFPLNSELKFLNKLKTYRESNRSIIKKVFPNLYNLISGLNRSRLNDNINKNFKVFVNLKKLMGENIILLHIPEKDEVLNSKINPPGIKMRIDGSALNLKIIDGFKECKLKINDYHKHDGHPNETGYRKIKDCAMRALDQLAK